MAGDALTFRVAFVVRWLLWVVRFVVIWPLATMALMALFVLWKDSTTPGKLLVQEIDFVRQTAPAGQFPVSECRFSSSDLPGAEVKEICHYRNVGAAEYARETDRSLKQLVSALWVTLALMYASLTILTGNGPEGRPRPFKYGTRMPDNKVRYSEKDIRALKENTTLQVYYRSDKTKDKSGEKNEHA